MSTANAFSVSGWTFGDIPSGWETVPGAGVRRHEKGQFGSNVVVLSDELPFGETLEAYIQRQCAAMKVKLTDAQFDGPHPQPFAKAEESLELSVQHTVEGNTPIVHLQLYTRRQQKIDVFTLTTNVSEAAQMKTLFKSILDSLTLS